MTYRFPALETCYIKVWGDQMLAAMFLHSTHEHNNFTVELCINARERDVVKFLIPILNLENRQQFVYTC